jgi:hypothetical protein
MLKNKRETKPPLLQAHGHADPLSPSATRSSARPPMVRRACPRPPTGGDSRCREWRSSALLFRSPVTGARPTPNLQNCKALNLQGEDWAGEVRNVEPKQSQKLTRFGRHRQEGRHSGVQLRVDAEFSHSVHKGGSVDTQADCSTISATDVALACGKRLYDFLALLPFILLGASVDVRT